MKETKLKRLRSIDVIYVMFWKRQNYRDRKYIDYFTEDGEGVDYILMEFWGVIEMCCILIVVIETRLCTFVKFTGLCTQRGKFYYMQITPQ